MTLYEIDSAFSINMLCCVWKNSENDMNLKLNNKTFHDELSYGLW